MKAKLFLLLCLSAFSPNLFALDFQKTAPLYDHLCEVNAEWRKQTPDASLLVPVGFSSDRERIQKHLELLENELRAREVSSLSTSQKANRLRHLAVLHGYWQTGVFPTNHYHAARQPYFRDNFGVLCAVGYLMWHDGQHDAIDKINFENNYAYIAELAGQYPELGAWAQENGFTLSELAWIQPAYDPVKPNLQTWGNGGGLSSGGRVNVMAKDGAETRLFVAGSFSDIDGFAANNIAAWDGSNWSKLGNGVIGEIFALEYEKGWNTEKLYVAGNFYLPGQPEKRNVAEYDLLTQTWKGLQTGDMQGSVFTLTTYFGYLFIGGDFQTLDGVPAAYTAAYSPAHQDWEHWLNPFEVDGPVRDFELVGSFLLVGGDFKKVYQKSAADWSDAPHLAYYAYWGDWLTLPHNLPPVHSLTYFNGNVFTGHKLPPSNSQTVGINVLRGGLWFENHCSPAGDSVVHGFLPLGDNLLAYGGFSNASFVFGSGAVSFTKDDVSSVGYLMADNTVRAMCSFQGSLYMVGDFQSLFGDAHPGMARILLPTSSVGAPGEQIPVQVIAAPDHLTLRYESLEQDTRLSVYDLQGRLLAQQTLAPGGGETILDADVAWASGLYVWHLENENNAKAGKWAVAR